MLFLLPSLHTYILVYVYPGIYKARTKPKIQKASLESNYKLVQKLAV